jgi:glycine oxidase
MWVRPPCDAGQATAWLSKHGWPGEPVPAAVEATLADSDGGLWLGDVAQVRNPRLVRALMEALTSRGVEVRSGVTVTGLEVGDGRVRAALSGPERLEAGAYVVCAGAWSREMLGPFALDLPVHPVRGQMLLYRTEPGRLPCIVHEGGRYLVPRSDGHILAGSTLEEVGFDKATTATARAELHAFVSRLLPDVAASGPVRHWAGLRPGSPGNVPIIDRHPGLTNLYANTGHFRYGVTLAPASAEMLAHLALGIPSSIDTTPYRWSVLVTASAGRS